MVAFINSNVAACPVIYRFLHQLKEDNAELINKLWTDIQQKITTQSQVTTPPETLSSAPPAGEQKGLLPHYLLFHRIVTRFSVFFLKHSNF